VFAQCPALAGFSYRLSFRIKREVVFHEVAAFVRTPIRKYFRPGFKQFLQVLLPVGNE